jgi:uracil-DNA glycosylase
MIPNMRVAKFGLRKTALSLTDGNNCRKCKLRKEGQTPLFTLKPPKRKSADEKIIVVLAEYARGPRTVFSDAELVLINNALRNIKVDTVYITPVVKCGHNKAPTKLMIECCESSLRTELETIQPNVIL